jgi:hypothetical protein
MYVLCRHYQEPPKLYFRAGAFVEILREFRAE